MLCITAVEWMQPQKMRIKSYKYYIEMLSSCSSHFLKSLHKQTQMNILWHVAVTQLRARSQILSCRVSGSFAQHVFFSWHEKHEYITQKGWKQMETVIQWNGICLCAETGVPCMYAILSCSASLVYIILISSYFTRWMKTDHQRRGKVSQDMFATEFTVLLCRMCHL